MELTTEHKAILEHTRINGRFCGNSKEMDELVEEGYMSYLGKAAWCPDPYFQITRKGIDIIQ